MYRLFGFTTQNSMKPLYVLEESGVEFEFNFVDLSRGEHKTPEFQAKTPMGKVPVLEHNGRHLFESGAIARYVANNENSPLYPMDAWQRAVVDQWMEFFTCHLGRWLNTLYFEQHIKPNFGLGETSSEACEEATRFSAAQSSVLDDVLSTSQWIASDALSIADLCAFAYMEQCQVVGFSLDGYPNIRNWYGRMEGRDSVVRGRARMPS